MSERPVPATVFIGRREVPPLVAALIAQEAARLDIRPRDAGDVIIPEPAPETVEIEGWCAVIIEVGAQLVAEADERGLLVRQMMALNVVEHVKELDQRARRRETRGPLEGAWMLPSTPGRRGGRGGNHGDA